MMSPAELQKRTPEARIAEVNAQALRNLATSPAFIASLNLPPSFNTLPPDQRSTKLTNIAAAVQGGNFDEYQRLMREINPSVSDLTLSVSYGQARVEYFRQRESVLMDMCINSTMPEREFWFGQLLDNLGQRRSVESSTQTLDAMSSDVLQRIEKRMRALGFKQTDLEEMYGSAFSRFSAPAVLSAVNASGIGALPSVIGTGTVAHNLGERAISLMRTMYDECRTKYSHWQSFPSDSSRAEFDIRLSRLRSFLGEYFPSSFNENVFGNSMFQQEDFVRGIDSTIRTGASP